MRQMPSRGHDGSRGHRRDCVLVQGDVDPRFKPVARSRAFTLYEKTSEPPDDTQLERGPCPEPPGPT